METGAGGLEVLAAGICPQLAVVLSGSVRVYKVGETGREITLYRIGQRAGSGRLAETGAGMMPV
jgi:CRP-like cAMP-binding protein